MRPKKHEQNTDPNREALVCPNATTTEKLGIIKVPTRLLKIYYQTGAMLLKEKGFVERVMYHGLINFTAQLGLVWAAFSSRSKK